MSEKIKYWKISPGQGGTEWDDWIDNNYSILYNWHDKPYFDKINKNLKDNYLGPDDFLEKTGFTGGVANDWRSQLKTFVWEVNKEDTVFAYKKGTFVGFGKLGKYYYDSEKGHIRDINWNELNPPLDLQNTSLIKVLSVAAAGTLKNIDNYREEILKITAEIDIDNNINSQFDNNIELLKQKCQIIFYGPPGTGKTYKAREFAVNFIEKYLLE